MLVDPAAIALAQTSGFSAAERQAIIALVANSAAWGHVDRAHAAVLDRVGARDFEWPEFDRWHTVFARRGAFPPLWEGLEYRPARGAPGPVRQAYRTRKFYLLIDWLHALVATRAEMRAALTRYATRGLSARITRQSTDTACPTCDSLTDGDAPGHAEKVPPFHPGCRCLILATTPSVRRSRR